MKAKLFVLSMDAMVHEDVAYLMTKPNFSRLMAKRAEVERVCSVYPASTYPAHTSILTGCLPGLHGIRTNVPLKTVSDGYPHWYLHSRSIRREDLFAAAKRAGCTTASVFWPITGNNPNIDHNIDEYFLFFPQEDPLETFARLGADEAALRAIHENLHLLPSRNPETLKATDTFDKFIMGCTCSLIRSNQPDVLLVHNCHLDSLRHGNGVFHENVTRGLDQMDIWLGDVMEAMEEAGVLEQTNFIILSDHGQMDIHRRVSLNALLVKEGLLELHPNGTIYDWQVFAQANGMSATVFLTDPEDEILYNQTRDFLQSLVEEPLYGFTRLYTRQELQAKYGTWGPFSFMLATDGHTAVAENWNAPVLTLEHASRAAHGYEPELGPQPVFLAHGPAFREGATLSTARLIDEAPTLAHILGQTMPQAQGRILQELLL